MTFEFCLATPSDHDCEKYFEYSTVDGKKPKSELKYCETSSDCGERGVCLKGNICECPPGRVGSNCQQIIFPTGNAYSTNDDGSRRCLKSFKPPPIADYPTIRYVLNDWESEVFVRSYF